LQTEEVWERFRRTGALLEGHFILSSGLHSARYLQCALALQHPQEATAFGAALAESWREAQIDAVASPAIGGLIIGYEAARALNVPFFWTERENGQMTLRRGFSVKSGARLLVVEDVVTTGGSTRETIGVLTAAGAEIVGAASIIDRSAGRAEVGVPRLALATLDVPAYAPEVCPECAKGAAAVKPGSRKI
jgi:orotate phosphoribosyltransferase